MNEKAKASPRLSAWIKAQIEASAKYVPYKGGICNICGKFCRTNRTDPEEKIRYHRCNACGHTFTTVCNDRNPDTEDPSKVGLSPTSLDEGVKKPVSMKKVNKKKKGSPASK